MAQVDTKKREILSRFLKGRNLEGILRYPHLSTALAGFTLKPDLTTLACKRCKVQLTLGTENIDLSSLHLAIDKNRRCPKVEHFRKERGHELPSDLPSYITVSDATNTALSAADTERNGLEQRYLSHEAKRKQYCLQDISPIYHHQALKTPGSEFYRLQSFKIYQPELPSTITAKHLPALGFFVQRSKTGGIAVSCYFCTFSVEVEVGLSDNQVLTKHKASSPTCPFIFDKNCQNIPYLLTDGCWNASFYDNDTTELPIESLNELGIDEKKDDEPELAVLDRRRATHLTNENASGLNIEEICNAGFYYIGHGKTVCFCCKLVVDNWENSENPWTRHARASPSCRFLINQKGQDFVTDVVAEHGEYITPEREPKIPAVTTRMLRPKLHTDVVQKAFSMVGNREVIRAVLIHQIKYGDRDFRYVSDLLRAAQERVESEQTSNVEGTSLQLPTITPYTEGEVSNNASESESEMVGDRVQSMETAESVELTPSAENSAATATSSRNENRQDDERSPASITNTQDKEDDEGDFKAGKSNEELVKYVKSRLICSVCMTDPVGITFLPCSHLVCCVSCAAAMTQCPMCRKEVKGTVRVHLR